MKKEISINRISSDEFLSDIVEMHKNIFINNKLYNKMIYYDNNFTAYFRTLLSNSNHFIYGIYKRDTILGFVHFRVINQSAFLNNIFISEKLRGEGVASKAIMLALNQMISRLVNLKYVELDVFESNRFVRQWYNRLGLIEQNKTRWFLITDNSKIDLTDDSPIRKKDDNGFDSIFLENSKIATVIKNSYIVAHDRRALLYKTSKPFIIIDTIEGFESIKSFINLQLMETSVRLKGSIEDVINKLSEI